MMLFIGADIVYIHSFKMCEGDPFKIAHLVLYLSALERQLVRHNFLCSTMPFKDEGSPWIASKTLLRKNETVR